MIMRPDLLRELDPRVSYLPPLPPATPRADLGAAAAHDNLDPAPHSSRTSIAMSMTNQPPLASMSIQELRRELERREKLVLQLQARREKIARELAELDAEIASLGGAAGEGGIATRGDAARPRGPVRVVTPRLKNTLSLTDALTAAIEPGTIVTPGEAAAIVRRDGYATQSKTFTQTVTVALSKHPRFKRVGRGQYECLDTAQQNPGTDE
jgi:hypothetical protein